MSDYFQKVANEVLKASEELSVRLEEGLTAMITGQQFPKKQDEAAAAAAAAASHDSTPPTPTPTTMMDGDDFEMEEEFMASPLQGIADSVLGDIMDGSVCSMFDSAIFVCFCIYECTTLASSQKAFTPHSTYIF